MNERILLEEGAFQELLGAADEAPTKPRSLDDLRARVYTLFRRIDQEAVQHAGLYAGNRADRDAVTHWPQREAISSPI